MAVLLPRLSSLACGKFANRRRILDDMAKYDIAHHIERSITPDWPAHMAYYNWLELHLTLR